jgi:hypothetical protein
MNYSRIEIERIPQDLDGIGVLKIVMGLVNRMHQERTNQKLNFIPYTLFYSTDLFSKLNEKYLHSSPNDQKLIDRLKGVAGVKDILPYDSAYFANGLTIPSMTVMLVDYEEIPIKCVSHESQKTKPVSIQTYDDAMSAATRNINILEELNEMVKSLRDEIQQLRKEIQELKRNDVL